VTPAPTATRTTGAVTPSPTSSGGGGGGGDGCSCRVDPENGRPSSGPASGWALAPLVVWWWRKRLARR
jgi:hypothetical protein